MNCNEASQYLFAHVDGELQPEDSLAVLDHLEVCPDCSGRVSAQRRMKASLRRVYPAEPAPRRIEQAIRARLVTAGTRGGRGASRRRWLIAGGLAAAAAIAVLIVSQGYLSSTAPRISDQFLASTHVTDRSPRAKAFADRIYEAHQQRVKADERGADPRLPASLDAAVLALRKELGIPILTCPEVRALGAQFVAASYCELMDENGKAHRGSHLYFRCCSGAGLSLVSVPAMPEMQSLVKKLVNRPGSDGIEYVVLVPPSISEEHLASIVAWNSAQATHIVCAPQAPDAAMDFAMSLETVAAIEPSGPQWPIRLAMLLPR